jgi:hypothetical protein
LSLIIFPHLSVINYCVILCLTELEVPKNLLKAVKVSKNNHTPPDFANNHLASSNLCHTILLWAISLQSGHPHYDKQAVKGFLTTAYKQYLGEKNDHLAQGDPNYEFRSNLGPGEFGFYADPEKQTGWKGAEDQREAVVVCLWCRWWSEKSSADACRPSNCQAHENRRSADALRQMP